MDLAPIFCDPAEEDPSKSYSRFACDCRLKLVIFMGGGGFFIIWCANIIRISDVGGKE